MTIEFLSIKVQDVFSIKHTNMIPSMPNIQCDVHNMDMQNQKESWYPFWPPNSKMAARYSTIAIFQSRIKCVVCSLILLCYTLLSI